MSGLGLAILMEAVYQRYWHNVTRQTAASSIIWEGTLIGAIITGRRKY